MRTKAKTKVNDEVLRSLFLNAVPENARYVLLENSEDLNKLAERVDKMLEYVTPSN